MWLTKILVLNKCNSPFSLCPPWDEVEKVLSPFKQRAKILKIFFSGANCSHRMLVCRKYASYKI